MRSLVTMSAVLSLCLISPCGAVSIDVTGISGAWSNVVPAPDVVVDNSGSTITLRWPKSVAGAPQSGYDFAARSGPAFTVAANTWFNIGSFAHYNQTIYGDSLTSVFLDVTLGMLAPSGGSPVSSLFKYRLSHLETPNGPSCTGLGLPQASASVCDDLVTIVNPTPSQTFSVGGTEYTLKLGFSRDGGNTILSYFQTQEDATNRAGLYAMFTTEVVPEPGFYGALTIGLGGLYFAARRRHSA